MSAARHPIVVSALELLAQEVRESDALTSPTAVRDYLRLALGDREHEVFVVIFLDTQNRVIEIVELFRGTLSQTAVYPREVVIEALKRNAAAVIVAHNHPSNVAQPSAADRLLTNSLKSALALVDVQVLDHFIVTRTETASFAEMGLL
jgi:DNA repair protein RadC